MAGNGKLGGRKRIQPFRSTLELIRLMDSAIGVEEEE